MQNGNRVNVVALAAGITVGVLWLAMAAASLRSAFHGLAHHRPDWWLAWFLVGILIGAAGTASIVGTCWHQFKVRRAHH